MTNATQIEQDIATILAGTSDDGETFIATRYPFTYAYDFARSNSAQFGFPSGLSRGETVEYIRGYAARTGQVRADVIAALADAYLTLWRVKATPAQRDAAMDRARRECWSSLDLPKPVGA